MKDDPSQSPAAADPSLSGRCGRKTRRGTCKAWPVKGATVCAAHGGRAPQVKAAAARRLAHAEWARSFGDPAPDADPTETVLNEIRWAAGHVAWLRERVAATDPDALVWGVTNEVARGSGEFPGVDETRAAKASVWLELYGQERDRLVRMCKVAHDMGIASRHIELAEKLGSLMGELLRNVLDELDLTEPQRAVAGVAVPRHLRAMTGAVGDAS